MAHVDHFLAEPLTDLPARRPTSRRRTQSVDMIGALGGPLELIGAAHDSSGPTASCHAVVGRDRSLSSLVVAPDLDTTSLLGLPVARGFRAAVDEISVPGTLVSALLTELPVAALLSGYGSLYTGAMPAPLSESFLDGMPVNICAGWDSEGTMMVRTRTDKMVPTPDGPPAPLGIDEEWHDLGPLAPNTMRRQRLIQRDAGEVWAMFRDTYRRLDGQVIVLHEYSLSALVENDTDGRTRVRTCEATPRVLPWGECPAAAASAARVEGHHAAELRALVKDEFTGTSVCTHLNDLLASLVQLDDLTESPPELTLR